MLYFNVLCFNADIKAIHFEIMMIVNRAEIVIKYIHNLFIIWLLFVE